MSDELTTCNLVGDKLECKNVTDGNEFEIPPMPNKIAWVIIVVAFVCVLIGVVLNHLTWSITTPVFVFPFFGGIPIPRDTLYDISLFLLVGGVIVIIIVFIFVRKKHVKVIVLK